MSPDPKAGAPTLASLAAGLFPSRGHTEGGRSASSSAPGCGPKVLCLAVLLGSFGHSDCSAGAGLEPARVLSGLSNRVVGSVVCHSRPKLEGVGKEREIAAGAVPAQRHLLPPGLSECLPQALPCSSCAGLSRGLQGRWPAQFRDLSGALWGLQPKPGPRPGDAPARFHFRLPSSGRRAWCSRAFRAAARFYGAGGSGSELEPSLPFCACWTSRPLRCMPLGRRVLQAASPSLLSWLRPLLTSESSTLWLSGEETRSYRGPPRPTQPTRQTQLPSAGRGSLASRTRRPSNNHCHGFAYMLCAHVICTTTPCGCALPFDFAGILTVPVLSTGCMPMPFRLLLPCPLDVGRFLWHLALSPGRRRLRPFSKRTLHLSWSGQPAPASVFLPLPIPCPGAFRPLGHAGQRRRQRAACQVALHAVVVAINFVYNDCAYVPLRLLARPPNPAQARCLRYLRGIVQTFGDVKDGILPAETGRRMNSLIARLCEISQRLTLLGPLGDPYAYVPSGLEVPTCNDTPDLEPYRFLCAERLRLSGRANWNPDGLFSPELAMAYAVPSSLLCGRTPAPHEYRRADRESVSETLSLAHKWASLDLLRLEPAEELQPFEYTRIFNAYKSTDVDRQIGDRRGMNAAESRLPGPSRWLPSGESLLFPQCRCSYRSPGAVHVGQAGTFITRSLRLGAGRSQTASTRLSRPRPFVAAVLSTSLLRGAPRVTCRPSSL